MPDSAVTDRLPIGALEVIAAAEPEVAEPSSASSAPNAAS